MEDTEFKCFGTELFIRSFLLSFGHLTQRNIRQGIVPPYSGIVRWLNSIQQFLFDR